MATAAEIDIVAEFYPASWNPDKGDGLITFSVTNVSEDWGNRIVPHERYQRPGARLEATGARYRIWRFTAEFYNGQEEPGVDTPFDQYPGLVDKLCDSCDTQETGILMLPTRGSRRCKAKSYQRTDNADSRNFASVAFEFWEDNEDDATAADYNQVSAAGRASPLANEAVAWSEAQGAGGFDMSDIAELASELEALATAPGDYVGDLEAKANAITNTIDRIEDTFTTEANNAITEVTLLLTSPQSSLAGRRLRVLADVVASAATQKASAGIGAVTTITYPRQMSIFDVANTVGQNPAQLMSLNSSIPNVLAIPAFTPIKVYDEAAA